MDNNDFSNDQYNSNTYKATTNLNTAMENPQYAVNSAVNVNIDNAEMQPNLSNTANIPIPNGDSGVANVGYNDFDFTAHTNSSNSQVVDSNLENNTFTSDEVSTNQFIPNTPSLEEKTDFNSTDNSVSNDTVTYAPVMEQTKKSGKRVSIPREVKIIIFIAFILLIFILLMPYIYDFFKELQLIITG